MSGFSYQGPRSTCDCISSPGRIPTVGGHADTAPRGSPRSIHIMGTRATMNPAFISHVAPHKQGAHPFEFF